MKKQITWATQAPAALGVSVNTYGTILATYGTILKILTDLGYPGASIGGICNDNKPRARQRKALVGLTPSSRSHPQGKHVIKIDETVEADPAACVFGGRPFPRFELVYNFLPPRPLPPFLAVSLCHRCTRFVSLSLSLPLCRCVSLSVSLSLCLSFLSLSLPLRMCVSLPLRMCV